MNERHTFQDQINYVQEYLHSRAIPYEVNPSRWGPVIVSEGVRFNFNKRTINVYHKKVESPSGLLDWDWSESLNEPGSPEETKALDDYLKLVCCMAHYASMARQITKAPEWIVFTTRYTELRDGEKRVTVQAWVSLNHLGRDTHMHYLAREEYVVIGLSYNHNESDRVRHSDFSNMVMALGSPVGSSYTDGHAPEAHGNFLTDGPFTFVPAKATIHTASNYVLPETEPESWDIWVLVRSHDIKMRVENSK